MRITIISLTSDRRSKTRENITVLGGRDLYLICRGIPRLFPEVGKLGIKRLVDRPLEYYYPPEKDTRPDLVSNTLGGRAIFGSKTNIIIKKTKGKTEENGNMLYFQCNIMTIESNPKRYLGNIKHMIAVL